VRLGLLIYGSLDTITGGFLYDRMLVQHLRGQGDRVEIISVPWRSYGLGLLDNLSSRLLAQLGQAPIDLLLQDELAHPSLFFLNWRMRRRISYPLVAMVHHLRSQEARPAWQNRLYRWVERQYLASVDALVFNSLTTKADVERLIGRKRPGVVAYPGGDGLPGTVTREQIAARATATGPLEIIFVANLIPRKELHTLLAALALLPREGWRLTVAGSLTLNETYVRAIRRQIQETGLSGRVALLGALSPEELARRLAQSHLLAVPSSYEGFGIVYLEGMRFGLPAIASSAGAAHEIISHGRDGFLVPPGDPGALSRCIRSLAQDRPRLATMGLAAYQRAARHPTWEESAALIRQFLHNFQG
jgi:glycosyltransferase involved in cell wall biosynthesis